MNDGKGYLIPPDAENGEYDCILVFYPVDSGNLYLRALVGSLAYLATWKAWEKDGEKRGRIASRIWKEANEKTWENMTCLTELTAVLREIRDRIGSGSTAVDLSPIVAAIGEVSTAVDTLASTIENQGEDEMVITNNLCCCSCGGGGNGNNPDDNLPPDIPPDDLPLPPLPPDIDDPYEPEQYPVTANQCAMAHYVLIQWRNLVIAIANGEITRVNFIPRLEAALPGVLISPLSGITWLVSAQAMLLYVALYFSGFVGRGGDAAREIDSKFEALKCAILNDSPIADKIAQGKVLIDVMSLPFTLRAIAKILWQYLPIRAIRASNADPVYYTLLPSWAFVPCPPCVGGGGGDDDPVNLGVWVHNGSSGHCGETTDELTAVWNTATRYNQNVTLSKTSSSGSYTWNISRNGNIGSDADYILVDLELTGHVTGYILRFYNVSSSVVHELDLGAETSQTVVIPYAAWFGSVTSVTLLRDSESYTQACPRIFGIDFSITAPGSSTWEDTET
jgi:hypothetical protein